MLRAVPRMALGSTDHHVSYRSLARVSAVAARGMPRQRFFTASDGARIAYRTYLSDSSLHLVLIHGSACFGDQMHVLANHVASRHAATVHTLDMRGHGRSAPFPADFDCYPRDIGEFVDALRRKGAPTAIALGGHSAGGGLVVNALTSPYVRNVSGCLLLAPFLGYAHPATRVRFGGWLARIRLFPLLQAMVASLFGSQERNLQPVGDFDSDAFLHDPRYARAWPFSAVFGFGPGPAAANAACLPDIPTLLVAGEADECFDAAFYPPFLVSSAPHATCALLPLLGHWDILTDNSALETTSLWLQTQFGGSHHENKGKHHVRYK